MHETEFSDELRLLTYLLRPELTGQTKEKINSIVAGTPDWNEFFRLIQRHRVVPLAWRGITRCEGIAFPEQMTERVLRHNNRNKKRALMQTAELIKLTRLFEENGIQAISLKGPVLAKQIYGDVGMRHAGDLDVLIDKESIQYTKKFLKEAGYVFTKLDSDDHHNIYAHHFNCQTPDNNLLIEVHWQLMNQIYGFSPESDLAFSSVQLNKQTIGTLPQDINFTYLILHGAQHAYMRLKWLCDIAEMVRKGDGLPAQHTPSQSGLLRAFRQTHFLLEKIFDIHWLTESTSASFFNEYALKAVTSKTVESEKKLKKIYYHLLLNQGMLNKVRYFIGRGVKWGRNRVGM